MDDKRLPERHYIARRIELGVNEDMDGGNFRQDFTERDMNMRTILDTVRDRKKLSHLVKTSPDEREERRREEVKIHITRTYQRVGQLRCSLTETLLHQSFGIPFET